MRRIRSFFNKHAISNLIWYLIIGNVAVFLADMMIGLIRGVSLQQWLTLDPAALFQGQVWRLFTFVLVLPNLGTDAISLIIWNALILYFYYLIGTSLEQRWGAPQFNMFFLTAVGCCWIYSIIGWLLSFVIPGYVSEMTSAMVYASMFLAFATLFPDFQLMIFFIIPVKVKWLGILSAVVMIGTIVYSFVIGNILLAMSSLASITAYLIWFARHWVERIGWKGHSTVRHAKFKSKIVMVETGRGSKTYRHKCCVCGKTDETDPDMQFRYCVQCSGLKEYCMDHIDDHTHS